MAPGGDVVVVGLKVGRSSSRKVRNILGFVIRIAVPEWAEFSLAEQWVRVSSSKP
jgi:hypothetical protein